MLELVKYIIAQFAEKPEEIEYKVEENETRQDRQGDEDDRQSRFREGK